MENEAFDTLALETDRWHDDGGRTVPDEDENELWRQSLADLRRWLSQLIKREPELTLVLDLAAEALSDAEFARSRGVHPSTVLRWRRRLFAKLRRQIGGDPALQASMPLPWRNWYFPNA